MPAVDLTRLRFQIQDLVIYFGKPEGFRRRLQELFSLYANRTLRFGEEVQIQPLMPLYHLPNPVMRQLKPDLQPYIQADAEEALALADELWQDAYFEVRQVAIFILDSLAVVDPEPTLTRIKQWLTPDLESILISELLSSGTHSLQDNHPQTWENLIASYLNQDNPEMIALGLEGLEKGVARNTYQNFPSVYRLIGPFMREPEDSYIHDLQNLVEALIKRSPTETAYFLRQSYAISTSPATTRLIKDCLPHFPDEIRQELRNLLNK